MANNFNKDMMKVFGMVREYFDLGMSLTECFYNHKTDEYEYDRDGFFYFLYDIVNHDMISITGKKIDVEASNHPDLAKILKRYATQDNINMVYDRIFN